MKPFLFLLLLLLPVCSAEFRIDCYSRDPLGMQPPVLNCRSDVEQACYSRDNGEKGCVTLEKCSRPGWTCCDGSLCNL
uniref:Wu:fj16a03 n=1 Tax=Hippocampus comes TaxID=109280 RepID=A0A3Q2XDN1_HIPCM